MSDQWEVLQDNPYGLDALSAMLDALRDTVRVSVRNKETDDIRHVEVYGGQSVGEAIAEGQFID